MKSPLVFRTCLINCAQFFTLASGQRCSRAFPINAVARISNAAHRSRLRRSLESYSAQRFQLVDSSCFICFRISLTSSATPALVLQRTAIVLAGRCVWSDKLPPLSSTGNVLPLINVTLSSQRNKTSRSSFCAFHFYW